MPFDTNFITLGTAGGPVPKLHRAAPAHAITYGDRVILIDCGEGAMQQLMRAGIDFRRIDKVILSHHHFDHIGSLFTCLGINMMLQRKQPEERQLRNALSVRRRQTEDAALVAWLVADPHRRFRCLRTQEVSSATRNGCAN